MKNFDKIIINEKMHNKRKNISITVTIIFCSFLLCSCIAEMDPAVANTPVGCFALLIELLSCSITAISGIGITLLGFWLMYAGYTGDVQLFMSGDGIDVKLINASPGLVVVFLGVFLIWRSRTKIKIKK